MHGLAFMLLAALWYSPVFDAYAGLSAQMSSNNPGRMSFSQNVSTASPLISPGQKHAGLEASNAYLDYSHLCQ